MLAKHITVIGALVAASSTVQAQDISITIENLQHDGGFFFTPFWVGVHDGSFDTYSGGEPSSNFPGLEALAEEGDTGPFSTSFASITGGVGRDTTILEMGGDGHPTLAPGESASAVLDVSDPLTNRYFSYASMIIPSNDLFVANGNPFAHELFDAGGNFNGPVEILIFGRDVVDNGTEVNDAFGGAAFSANGGAGVDENGLLRDFFTDLGPDSQYLASFIGSDTATGDTITAAFSPDKAIARITVVPAPGAIGILAGGILIGARRRRR
ncbi:MAG: PEP-CTERM sorting domain-containing protein [Phycisphaera sp.]|nr:MAG: PEP-CTERM sorting domain-containing protein [Phycisphaera sp.]